MSKGVLLGQGARNVSPEVLLQIADEVLPKEIVSERLAAYHLKVRAACRSAAEEIELVDAREKMALRVVDRMAHTILTQRERIKDLESALKHKENTDGDQKPAGSV